MLKLSCGYCTYVGGRPFYSPEFEWSGPDRGFVKFGHGLVIIEFDSDQFNSFRVEIPFRAVENAKVSSRPPSITLSLLEPPRFFRELYLGQVTQPARFFFSFFSFSG